MADFVGLLQEAIRKHRLSQFDAEDRFTRFSGEARFVERALEMARKGTKGINNKSVFTSFASKADELGNTEVLIFPNVQEQGGKLGAGGVLTDFTDMSVGPRRNALDEAMKNNNVLRLPVGNENSPGFKERLREAEEAADRWTKGFSTFLGEKKR